MSKQKYHSSMISSLWHLDRMDMWKKYGSGYANSQTIGDYKVEYDDDDTDDKRIFIWSKNRPCVAMVLSKSTNIAVMDGVYYDPNCTIDGKMKRGEGTRKMIEFALNLLRKNGVKRVELSDRSTIQCNGKKIRLPIYYFFKYGKTWYEKNFGFKPLNHKDIYLKYQKSVILQDKPCDWFTDENIHDYLIKDFSFLLDMTWYKDL